MVAYNKNTKYKNRKITFNECKTTYFESKLIINPRENDVDFSIFL